MAVKKISLADARRSLVIAQKVMVVQSMLGRSSSLWRLLAALGAQKRTSSHEDRTRAASFEQVLELHRL